MGELKCRQCDVRAKFNRFDVWIIAFHCPCCKIGWSTDLSNPVLDKDFHDFLNKKLQTLVIQPPTVGLFFKQNLDFVAEDSDPLKYFFIDPRL